MPFSVHIIPDIRGVSIYIVLSSLDRSTAIFNHFRDVCGGRCRLWHITVLLLVRASFIGLLFTRPGLCLFFGG